MFSTHDRVEEKRSLAVSCVTGRFGLEQKLYYLDGNIRRDQKTSLRVQCSDPSGLDEL